MKSEIEYLNERYVTLARREQSIRERLHQTQAISQYQYAAARLRELSRRRARMAKQIEQRSS